MATIYYNGQSLIADRPIEHPWWPTCHSVGGFPDVPRHNRTAHAAGLPCVPAGLHCAQIRSARLFSGFHGDEEEIIRSLIAQYATGNDLQFVGRLADVAPRLLS